MNNLQDFNENLTGLKNINNNLKRSWVNNDVRFSKFHGCNTYEEYEKNINNYINKHILDKKILLHIYKIEDDFYILNEYLNEICTRYNLKIPIYNWFSKYLFKDSIIKSDYIKNCTKEFSNLPYKYIQYNNEISKVIKLNNFIDNDELHILYNLSNTDEFENEIIKICGTKNKIEQEHYQFIFKNVHFNFINYISDIDRLKLEYEQKFKELNDKLEFLTNN